MAQQSQFFKGGLKDMRDARDSGQAYSDRKYKANNWVFLHFYNKNTIILNDLFVFVVLFLFLEFVCKYMLKIKLLIFSLIVLFQNQKQELKK